MILTLLDTDTQLTRIIVSKKEESFWMEREGSWDGERGSHFGKKPVKGQEITLKAERFLIVKVDEEKLDFKKWNKNYSPFLIAKAMMKDYSTLSLN